MEQIKGVNLGGWLVLERWIVPSLFNGLSAQDEFSFCGELGNEAAKKLKEHRDTFMTEQDFKWLKEQRFNALRIPVGYWVFGDVPPYQGAIEYLDFAMEAAKKYGLSVVIDLHGAPGSQNGWKHSGQEGRLDWHKDSTNIELTLNIIGKLAERYCQHKNLVGIELLNEPRPDIPKSILVNFYQKGYKQVRKYCNANIAVIISDAFRPRQWQKELLPPEYENVWLDCHLYQVFDEKDKKLSLEGHIKKAKNQWSDDIVKLQKAHPVVVGEWSMALDQSTLKGLSEEEKHQALKTYANTQTATFSQSKAWFYWTYKTENDSAWSIKHMLEQNNLNL